MTPKERHADAVKAAKQWRDEQRGAPKRGDVITIRWPGGPHDFTMVFDSLDDSIAPHEPGWMFLFGYVGETEVKNLPFKIRDWRTIYARKVEDGVYEMIPHGPSA